MSREVDVKALISHLIRGDGADKCRICMGDTSEGQVYLGDTVMMDGEKPVTLGELLEVITGVEVVEDAELPNSLCSTCSGSAVDAARFSVLCQKARTQWNTSLHLLNELPMPKNIPDFCKSIFAILEDAKLTLVHEFKHSAKGKVTNDSAQLVSYKRSRNTYQSLICVCPMCNKTFRYARELSNHLKQSGDYQRACHICAKIMSRDDLISHLSSIHEVTALDCKKCPAIFHSYFKYKKHTNDAHVDGACTCGDCGRSFQSEFGYCAHLSVHLHKKCPSCDQLFRNRLCFLHHLKVCCKLDKIKKNRFGSKTKKTVEVRNKSSLKRVRVGFGGSTQNECICDFCGKKFGSKKLITAHIQHVHMKNTHRPCPYCGKLLASAHMTEHIKNHELVRLYKCEYCNIELKTRLGFIQHLRLHTGERPFPCKLCGESFPASSRRSEHIRRVHKGGIPLKHACEICPARFALPFRLRKHMAAVHSGASNIVFECKECHVKFSTCRGLIHHERKHQKDVMNPAKKKSIKLYPE